MVRHYFGIFERATVLTPLGSRGSSSAMLYRTSSVLLLYNLRQVSIFIFTINQILLALWQKSHFQMSFGVTHFFIKMQNKCYYFVIIICKSMLLCYSLHVVSMLMCSYKTQCCAKCRKHHMVWHFIIWCDMSACHAIWFDCHTIWYEL